jgi:hypothetical protein
MVKSKDSKCLQPASEHSESDDSYSVSESPKHHKTEKCKKPNKDHDDIEWLKDKINKCIKIGYTNDKKFRSKLLKLNDKINQTKTLVNYESNVKRLRKEKYLMVNGSDSYGMFYSYSPQIIEPNETLLFETSINMLNLCFSSNTDYIKIKRSGIYVINLTCQFNEPGQIALFINSNPELSSLTSTSNSLNCITIHQILNLCKGDKVSVRNYLSSTPLTTIVSSPGSIPDSKNICLNIWKIAPEHKKCAFPPKQNKKAWCYFESESDSSSSDSDSSECSYIETPCPQL